MLLAHLAFIVFAALGALTTLVWRRAPWLHVPAATWGVLILLCGGTCPLTPLENALRRAAGERTYAGGFLAHYVVPLIYPPGLTARAQVALGVALALINAALYAWLLQPRRFRENRSA